MRVSTRVASLVVATALIAPVLGCAHKSKIQLEMTRETVLVSPDIQSVTVDPSGRVDTREGPRTVRVTMTGDPGLTGTFDVAGLVADQPMQETRPGVYTGSFTLPQGESGELRVSARLVDAPTGASREASASGTLTAWVSPPPPVDRCTPEMAAAFDARLRELTIHYEFGSWEIPDAEKEKLQRNKDVLASNPLCPIYVLGHSDNVGSPEYNMRLSHIRAIHAGSYLITLGIDKDRLREYFFGEQHPEVQGDSPEARSQNRRVEFRASNPY